MTVLQIIQTIIVYGWLFAVLVLLMLIWRQNSLHIQKTEHALIEASVTSSQAAKLSAEAALKLASAVQGKTNA